MHSFRDNCPSSVSFRTALPVAEPGTRGEACPSAASANQRPADQAGQAQNRDSASLPRPTEPVISRIGTGCLPVTLEANSLDDDESRIATRPLTCLRYSKSQLVSSENTRNTVLRGNKETAQNRYTRATQSHRTNSDNEQAIADRGRPRTSDVEPEPAVSGPGFDDPPGSQRHCQHPGTPPWMCWPSRKRLRLPRRREANQRWPDLRLPRRLFRTPTSCNEQPAWP